jgi:hypothetical protein
MIVLRPLCGTENMQPGDKSNSATTASLGANIKANWVNPRRKRFWAILATLLYTLLGFFVVPLIVKDSISSLIQEDLGRSLTVEKVEFNPYVLSLRVQGFEMNDTDGVKLASFDEFVANFQLSSLFRRAWTFREIRLDGSSFFFERFDAQDWRLGRILSDLKKRRPGPSPAEPGKRGLPRLLIHDLSVNEGRLDARDNLPSTPVETYMDSINISIQELNTLPDRHGRQLVNIQLPNGSSLHWEGSLSLSPLDSEGDLVLKNSDLAQTISYLEAIFPLDSISVRMSSKFHYRLHLGHSGELELAIDELEIELNELQVSGLTPSSQFFSLQKVSLLDGEFQYPDRKLHFGSMVFDQPRLTAWLSDQGEFSLGQLRPSNSPAETSTADAGSPWQFSTDEWVLQGGVVSLSDQSLVPEAKLNVMNLDVRLEQLNNADGSLFPLNLSAELQDGGSFRLEGQLGLLPEISLQASSHANDIPLALAQPYLQQKLRIDIQGGDLNSEINLSLSSEQALRASGSISLPGLELSDAIENERLLGWSKLEIEQFDFDLGNPSLHLSSMMFDQPYGRLVIFADKATNLARLGTQVTAAPAEAEATETTAVTKENPAIIIGGISIDDGSMDFSDLSLPLPFSTHIAGLDGTISTIATRSTEPANVKLEGQVDEFGLARINGTINVLDPIQHTGITLEFRNLLMSELSPYSIQFAGQKIDEGRLDLDLVYAIDEGQLNGQNDVVLRDLLLGEKVDNPDAVSLPLGLAVALLKDSNGVIDIDLPVEGDINDPEFRIGGVVWKAFSTLITKMISAPFRLLGKLIGSESDDLGQFEFLAGRSDLTPPELEKITQLEQALVQRPELTIEINGVSDPAIDIPALKYKHLRDLALTHIGAEDDDKDSESLMLDTRIRQYLEILHTERMPQDDLQLIRAEYLVPATDDKETEAVFDELAYATELWNRLLESEPVSEQDLENLAQARAEAIRAAFLLSGQFAQARIQVGATQTVDSEDGEWVALELAVAAK